MWILRVSRIGRYIRSLTPANLRHWPIWKSVNTRPFCFGTFPLISNLVHIVIVMLTCHSSTHFSTFHKLWPQNRISCSWSSLRHSVSREAVLNVSQKDSKYNENQPGANGASFLSFMYATFIRDANDNSEVPQNCLIPYRNQSFLSFRLVCFVFNS